MGNAVQAEAQRLAGTLDRIADNELNFANYTRMCASEQYALRRAAALLRQVATPADKAQPVQEPVAWMDEFGNTFPLNAWKPAKATHHDEHKHGWKPLYLSPHPPADKAQPDYQRMFTEAVDDAKDAVRWRMLPGFLEEHQINYLRLLRDIDAALSEHTKGTE
jgi:hypothetical protein